MCVCCICSYTVSVSVIVHPYLICTYIFVSVSIIKFVRVSNRLIVKLLSISSGKEIILKLGVKNTVKVNIDSEVTIFIIKVLSLIKYIEFFSVLIIYI